MTQNWILLNMGVQKSKFPNLTSSSDSDGDTPNSTEPDFEFKAEMKLYWKRWRYSEKA